MTRGSIVVRVALTVAALTILQTAILLGTAIASFRSQLAAVRVDLAEEGIALARLAVEPASAGESIEARVDRLASLRGFALALYDDEGRLLHATREDVAVEEALDPAVREEARARAGGALILRGSPNVPTAAIASLEPGSAATADGARFIGLFEENTVEQVARGRVMLLATLGVGIVVFTLLLTLFFTRRARAGLREIETVVHRMAEGDLSVRMPVRTNDEVGRVVADFNRMADALADRLEQLRRAEAHRQRTEAERTRLFAAFTHEISTPLTSVLGYLESLRMPDIDGDPETRRRYVEIAFAQARALDALADDLATLSRLEFEGLPLSKTAVDLAGLVRTELASFEPRAKERSIALALEAPAPLTVELDAQRIGQVLRILLDNALRHTGDGTTVRVSLTQRGAHAVLEVEDEGPGVAAEQLERLGEPLHRVDASRTRGTGGRGLGLSIARGIARAHDGTLTFESPPGRGLTVTLSLPLAE